MIGQSVTITIEIPRWSFAKYTLSEPGGQLEFISPLPCPFNYGFVAGHLGGDQMPLDAIVMGGRLARGSEVQTEVRAFVHFVDNDENDDKLVCSSHVLRSWEVMLLKTGFPVYVRMKRFVNWCKGKRGKTHSDGLSFR